MKKIRNKIFLVILCCSLVVMSVFGAIAINTVSTVLVRDAEQGLVWLARYYAREFSVGFELIEDKVQEMDVYIKNTLDVQRLKKDRTYLAEYEKQLVGIVEDFANKRTMGIAGWVYFDPRWSDEPHDVYFVDGDGDGLAERQKYIPFSYYDMTPQKNDDKEWWYGPVRTRKGFWTNPYEWTLRNEEVIKVASFALPIYIDNEFIGVVGTYYRFNHIVEAVRSIRVYQTGYASLFNEKLDAVVHPEYFSGTRHTSDNLSRVQNGRLRAVAEHIEKNPYGVVFYEVEGQSKIMAYCKLRNGWVLGLHPPLDEVYSSLYSLVYMLGAAVVGCLLLAVTAAYIMGRSITKPLLQVAEAAQAIGAGDLSVRVRVDSQDETKTLAITLNSMTESMQYMTTSLKNSRARLEGIVTGAGMYTWDYDVKNGTMHHNAQFMRALGEKDVREDIKPILWLRERIHPEDRHVLDEMDYSQGLGSMLNFEVRMSMADGEWRWFQNMGRIEDVNSQGSPTRVVGTGFDMHAQKMAKISEAEQKMRLEELVARRTLELQESRNQAVVASNAKTAFLSTVSHEIRTPMNAIVGFAHIFDRSNLTPLQQEYLDKIKLSAGALLNVINDVLDISKIEAGKLELETVPFQLHNVLDTVCSIVGFAARDKGLELQVDVAAEVPGILRGDPKRISQILLNLMNNAVKFTSQGQVRLTVGMEDNTLFLEKDMVELAFCVEDTGIGLSSAQISRLFQPFTQADSSITRKYGGTGLGLAICKQLVELMGGHIGVSSELGKGAVFHFTLRLEVPEHSKLEDFLHQSAVNKVDVDMVSSLKGKRVLVVEDNPINQEIARALLEECGLLVEMADNGREALGKVTSRYDGILMDMQMPIMDGLEATRVLRDMGNGTDNAYHWLTNVPIIAMTANAMAEDKQRCMEAGMNDHVAKPFDLDTLHSTLLRWMGTHSQGV